MNAELRRLASRLRLDSPEAERLCLAFAHDCAQRVEQYLEDPQVRECLRGLSEYLAGRTGREQLHGLSLRVSALATAHHGSASIDGCGHAAVSATYAVANAVGGKALEAASYAAYAAVYGQGGYGAVSDPSSFEPENSWQVEHLASLAASPLLAGSAAQGAARNHRISRPLQGRSPGDPLP